MAFGKRDKVEHHCEIYNLEEKDHRKLYGSKMSEILSDEYCRNIKATDVTKKMKIFSPDESIETDQLWKMVEWDKYEKKEDPEKKRTAEDDIP